jgi:hypothetical protein
MFERSLVATEVEGADQNARSVAALLDGIPGAYEQAQLGLKQAIAGQTIPLEELSGVTSA